MAATGRKIFPCTPVAGHEQGMMQKNNAQSGEIQMASYKDFDSFVKKWKES